MEQLEDMFLTRVAEERRVTKSEASDIVQKCIQTVADKLNKNFKEVYAVLKTWTYQAGFLKGACSGKTLDECSKMCYCVFYKNRCYPRYLPEANVINYDPETYVKALDLRTLQELVEIASYLYYNFDGGGFSDNAFDALDYELNKRLKVTGRRFEKVGAEPIEKLRVKLPYPMMSLDKLKPDNKDLLPFLFESKKYTLVCSEKLDGVSCMVVYQRDGTIKLYTRGDGTYGGDITYLKDYIKLPDVYKNRKFLAVRGELMMSKKVWSEKYKGLYANPRSMVSAKVNQGFVSDSLKDIRFVAYQVVDTGAIEQSKPEDSFKLLEKLGFETPYYTVVKSPLLYDIVELYTKRRAESDYTIDGLVMAQNRLEDLDSKNPSGTKAFKMLLEEQIRDTNVVDIDWGISRHGKYIPVAVFKPIYVDGVRLTRATAHNAKWVIDRSIGVGTRIRVARSGDVIPQVKEVLIDKTIQPILPGNEVTPPPKTYPWHWEGSDIVLDDIEGNPIVKMKRLLHFFQTIGVRGLGDTRLQQIVDKGKDRIIDLTQMTVKDFNNLNIPRFTGKTTLKIYDSIHEQMRKTRLSRYMSAMTTLKANIGQAVIRQLNRVYPEVYEQTSEEILERLTGKNPLKVPGVGPKRIPEIASGIPEFMKELKALNKSDIAYAIKYQKERLAKLKTNGYNKNIQGKKFILTGFMGNPPEDLVDYIWDHQGEVVGGAVNNKISAVIANTIANVSDKMVAARNQGIPVYSKEEFVLTFNIPIDEVNIRISDDLLEDKDE